MGRRNKPLIVKHTDHRLDLGPAGHNLFISRDKQLAERSARRLRLGMRVVVALLVTLGALAALLAVWFYLVPFFHREFQVDGASSQESSLSQEEEEPALPVYDDMGLPVYGDEVNLFVINESQPAEADVVPQLEEAEGVQVDARIADAVTLLAAAARDMNMQVDEAGSHPLAACVQDLDVGQGFILVQVRGNAHDFFVCDENVLPPEGLRGIDISVFQQL